MQDETRILQVNNSDCGPLVLETDGITKSGVRRSSRRVSSVATQHGHSETNFAQDGSSHYSIVGKCIDVLRLYDTAEALVVGCVRLKEKTRMLVYYPHDENREIRDISVVTLNEITSERILRNISGLLSKQLYVWRVAEYRDEMIQNKAFD